MTPLRSFLSCALVCVLFALGALVGRPATFTVTTTNQTGPGSLAQAILDANASPGFDTLQFALPSQTRTIMPTNALPAVTDPVLIDGTTQPGFFGPPLVEISGQLAGAGVSGLRITGGGTIVRSLVINRFSGSGIEIINAGSNRVEGCYVGLNSFGNADFGNGEYGILITNAADNIVGSDDPARANVISGNTFSGIIFTGSAATGNKLIGNTVGLSADRTVALGNSGSGILIRDAANNVIGAPGHGNRISGNGGGGVAVGLTSATGNVIRANHILQNTGDGIWLNRASDTLVGGGEDGALNVISGNTGNGITIGAATAAVGSANNRVQGNYIGVDPGGTSPLPNSGHGISLVGGARDSIIGGDAPNLANRIMFNAGAGVLINGLTNNLVRRNVFQGNGQLAIDIGANSVTPNDPLDFDGGPNLTQNYPTLTTISNSSEGTVVNGTLSSRPSSSYTVDIYITDFCDPTGSGEGTIYAGAVQAITDSSGFASFAAPFPLTNLPGRMFTATATDARNNTSEFSPCVPATSTLPAYTYVVTTTNDAGPGSLRQAMLDASQNINAGDRIEFSIPGPGPHTIAPLSRLPFITDRVTIDGYTQPGAAPNTLSNGFNADIRIRLDGQYQVENIKITAGEATIRGLALVRLYGHGIEIVSNAWDCKIQGNLIGVDLDGSAQGNVGTGIFVDTRSHLIGGVNPADRNVVGGNYSHGIYLGQNASQVVAQGNFVGTDPTGRFARINQGCGFYYFSAQNNLIGGTQPGAGNLISGNYINGIELTAGASAITVQGNLIGTDVTGAAPLPNSRGHGILMGVAGFALSASNTVGGVTPGAGNVIAFNRLDGVHIDDGTNHLVRGNSIFSNGQLGIDLGTQEIGPLNDPGDLDKGANDFQNHPVLTAATNQFTALYLSGTLNSRTTRTYFLDFFGNQQCDTSGRGEGEAYLGSITVQTDSSGNANFSTTFPINRQPLQWLTATATDSFGNTSEFSPCLPITIAPPTLNVTASSGHIQLRWPGSTPTNFALETTTNLSAAIWESVTGQINTDGDSRTFGFNIEPSEAARFFRLRSSQ